MPVCDLMAKASRAAKARVKRSTLGERAQIKKSARVLADFELITTKRFDAILRTLKACR